MFHHSREREAFVIVSGFLRSYLNLEEGYTNEGHANRPRAASSLLMASLFDP